MAAPRAAAKTGFFAPAFARGAAEGGENFLAVWLEEMAVQAHGMGKRPAETIPLQAR